jgi:acyl transferase domain-containing protein
MINLLSEELNQDAATSIVKEAAISQPACTAIQLGLTDLLKSWGIRPSAVTGHSSGEIGAAYAAGLLGLEECMAIAYYRGSASIELKNDHPSLKGAMVAVGGGPEEISKYTSGLKDGTVKIACINSPSSVTVSGDEPAICELQALLDKKQIFNRKLQVDIAYHSHHMNLVADNYLEAIKHVDPASSSDVAFYSSLLGTRIKDTTRLHAGYWVDNLTSPVRFSEALAGMCQPIDGFKTQINVVVELGPHSALAGPIKQILKSVGTDAAKIPYVPTLVRNKDAVETTLQTAATLFLKGSIVDFGAINFPRPGKKPILLTDMPRYSVSGQFSLLVARVFMSHFGTCEEDVWCSRNEYTCTNLPMLLVEPLFKILA